MSLIAATPLMGRDKDAPVGSFKALPVDKKPLAITVGEVWNTHTNYGRHGDPAGVMPSYSRPGDAPGENVYYLWHGGLWIAAFAGGQKYVTHDEYNEEEWTPSPDNGAIGFAYVGPGKSYMDVEARYQDFSGDPDNASGRHLGLKVIERVLSWPHHPYNEFFVYEVGITYDKNSADIPSPPDVLQIYVGYKYDADVCGADHTDPHIDDLVYYDGAPEECGILLMDHKMGWEDEVTVLSDTVIPLPDGIPDGFTVWGDDPEEKQITIAYYETHFGPGARPDSFQLTRPARDGGTETVYYYYLIPRNMSVIYDGDNPAEPGDDRGEGGACSGWIGMRLIYAPPSPEHKVATNGQATGSFCSAITTAKSTGPNDTIWMIYPRGHQWWNWENDPPNDVAKYDYIVGDHPATRPYRFAPHPYDFGASEFDYRFLLTSGPHSLADGDTLWFVFVGAVGEGLNGGPNDHWYGGAYRWGLRTLMDKALVAYYTGVDGLCDPAHPCSPIEGNHWQIPVPPVSPFLSYGTSENSVILMWDKRAENTPDPIKQQIDFVGYAVYRAVFAPNFTDPPLKVIIDKSKPQSVKDALRGYWAQYFQEMGVDTSGRIVEKDLTGQNTYVDSDPPVGYPLYYAVTAFDTDTLESAKDNYLKTASGAPMPVYVGGVPGTGDWTKDIVIAPNPVYGSTFWSATSLTPEVKFFNVPAHARIDIYSFTGDHIQTLYNNLPTKGYVTWNLLTPQGRLVAPGIYFVRITDGEKVYYGKFVVLR